MSRKRALAVVLLVGLVTVGATIVRDEYFLEEDVRNNGSDLWCPFQGYYSCLIWGDPWGGASATVQTRIKGTNPAKAVPISVGDLVGVVVDTAWVGVDFSYGDYRILVTGGDGSERISWNCRRVQR